MKKLHVGAFDQIVEGWINTDVTPHLFVARVPGLARFLHALRMLDDRRMSQHREGVFRMLRYVNVRKRLPFPDGTIDAIYSSHMLEHLTREDGLRFLSECHRVLRPDGVIRTAVPDLDRIVREYRPADPTSFLDELFEIRRNPKNRHWWHYNEASLRSTLSNVGFSETFRACFRTGICPDVERIDCRPESLFIEARK